MRRAIVALTLSAAVGVGGCTTRLEVDRAGPSVESRSGFGYALQFTQYTVTVTRRLASCDDGGLSVADIKAEVVGSPVDDGDHVYTIKPNKLISPMKISQIELAWEEGRLTSLNASAEDRSAQAITAVASGVAKLAVSAALAGVADTKDPHCSAKAIAELGRAKLQQGVIKDLDTKVSEAQLKLDEVGLKLVKEPKNKSWLKEQSDLVEAMGTYKKDLTSAQKALKSALEFLTHTTTITWPETGREFSSAKPDTLPVSTLMTWLEIPKKDGENDVAYGLRSKNVVKNERAKFDVWFNLERVGTYGRDPVADNGKDDADTADASAGLRYRLPAQGRLVVCKGAQCTSTDDAAVIKHLNPVLQLGRIFYVPFSNPIFANGSVAIAFDKYGRPTSAAVKRINAAAETGAGAFRDVASETAGVLDKLQEAPLKRLQGELAVVQAQQSLDDAKAKGTTELELLKKETDLLKAKKDLLAARNDLEVDPIEQLGKDAELAKAKASYLAAMKALEADPNADRTAQTAGFQADAALFAAEKAKIEAELALAEVKAKQVKP